MLQYPSASSSSDSSSPLYAPVPRAARQDAARALPRAMCHAVPKTRAHPTQATAHVTWYNAPAGVVRAPAVTRPCLMSKLRRPIVLVPPHGMWNALDLVAPLAFVAKGEALTHKTRATNILCDNCASLKAHHALCLALSSPHHAALVDGDEPTPDWTLADAPWGRLADDLDAALQYQVVEFSLPQHGMSTRSSFPAIQHTAHRSTSSPAAEAGWPG
eukprot:CAMPEP_0185162844 /NCGR_PEP_ID=MMETSP1139-20130426/7107_1 /TAXON_ID=298111 /ORGANISM="Pavlova sp., Strain CCMP459" /LENGTH=215 /DNA_ID=CAMNT_0027728185 /DNA_START=501 /DNA_END=1148 /DNA_ORIENTATION=-